MNPLDELKSLDAQVDLIGDLAGLKPIFYRLEEIAKANAGDFEVQLVAGDVKQHLINRGVKLRELSGAATQSNPALGATGGVPAAAPPPLPGGAPSLSAPPPMPDAPAFASAAPPPFPASFTGDLQPPRKLMSSGQFAPAEPPAPSFSPSVSPSIPPAPDASTPPLFPTQAVPAAETTGSPFSTGPMAQAGMAPPMPPPPMLSERPLEMPSAATEAPPQRWTPGPPSAMPPPQAASPQNWKRPVMVGALIAILIGALGIGLLIARKRTSGPKEISVSVATTPAGASVRVNGQPNCTSPCELKLPPGDHQITAFLDGYEPAASGVTVATGKPVPPLALALEPLPQTIRVLTDLAQGKVALDDQAPVDLQEGQVVLEKVAPGPHMLKVTGPNADASLSIHLADAQVPSVDGKIQAHNLLAVVVTSMAGRGRLTTSAGPLKLAVNGQPEADAGPDAVDLHAFQPGVDELIVGADKDQRSMKESFGPAPTATVFLKTDQNIGTLIVSAGEDNVRVFVNNKEYPRRTQRGQLRIQTIGPVSVRVAKDGFETLAAQTGEVKKGAELRLEFKMKSLPQFATLQLQGATAGAEVLVDNNPVGVVGPDGSFTDGTVAPGDHSIELRREHFVPRKLDRTFRAGQAVSLSGSDVVLAAERVAPPPVEVKKAPPPPPPPPKEVVVAPPVKLGTMADFENPAAWKQEGDVWSHRGAAFLPFKPVPRGVFQFTVQLVKGGSVFRGGRIRWALNYTDSKNYALFELENKNFWAKEVVKGKTSDRAKTQLNLDKVKMFTVQVEVTPQRVVHTILIDNKWFSMDSWTDAERNFTDGKFGFLVQGDDEIAISDFKFTPKSN
ncbi:MAG TPA: PEGA domain-containing protein [Bryobacteraceae bacterium]|nr:PEGA domain-containing protein [Bryobacteraceae bacterium]